MRTLAAPTTISTCFQLWRRPMSFKIDRYCGLYAQRYRLKPALRSFSRSSRTEALRGSPTVTSLLLGTRPEPRSSSQSSSSLSTP